MHLGEPMIAPAQDPERIVYPAEDDVAETVLHLLIRTFFLALVRRWLALRGVRAFAGSDQFIYWVQGNPHRTAAPDLYVLFGVDPDRVFRSWKVWEEHVVPRFVMEVVSDDVYKDYVTAPMRYADLGVDELVIFDPEAATSPDRVRWQVYRRRAGELVLELRSAGDRVVSEVLDCHLRWVPEGDDRGVVRLGTGVDGDELVPTAEEAERAGHEAERARRIELEEQIEGLRRQLALRGEG